MSNFVCQYCEKGFAKEKTLLVHMCEQKRRWLNKDEKYVRIGFEAFQMFYHIGMNDKTDKDYKTFMKSPYYLGFTKFGKYMEHLDAVEPLKFVEYLIRGSIALDKWTTDRVYNEYVKELYRKESADRALERTVLYIQEWADKNDKEFSSFFREITTTRATQVIRSGRVSPWVILNCDSGIKMLGKLNDKEMKIVSSFLDIKFWKQKFELRKADVEFVQTVIEQAGL